MDKEQVITTSYENSRKETEHNKSMNSAIELGRAIMALLGPNKRLFLEYERAACMANEVNIACAYELGMECACRPEVKDVNKIDLDDPKMPDQAREYYLAFLNLMQSGGKVGYLKIVDGEVEFVETADQEQDVKPSQFPLCAIRINKGYTEDEAAKHCGVSTKKMKEIEADPGKMKASMTIKLRNLYGIPLDYISI